jgi:EAL domain-containing protein (putative c-di-GMP-specific phosphodiesterase class I)
MSHHDNPSVSTQSGDLPPDQLLDHLLFSLNDFGTGDSSLSYLKRFPFGTLKANRSFVNDVRAGSDAGAIAEMNVTLGKTLGMNVIAEGVENEQQFGFLRAQQCDAFQGFLFAPALPLDEFERRHAVLSSQA